MTVMPEVACVNIARREVVLEDGEILPVTNAFDSDGDDADLEDAVACVAGPDRNGLWVHIDFRDMEKVTVQ